MLMIVLRVLIFFGLLYAIYWALDRYMWVLRARELEAEHAGGADKALSREDFVAKGLAVYSRSWQRRALLGIFALPFIVFLIVALLAQLV